MKDIAQDGFETYNPEKIAWLENNGKAVIKPSWDQVPPQFCLFVIVKDPLYYFASRIDSEEQWLSFLVVKGNSLQKIFLVSKKKIEESNFYWDSFN